MGFLKNNKVNLGKKYSTEHRRKISVANKGKKHTDESRRKISLGKTGKQRSLKSRLKQSTTAKLRGVGKWMRGKTLSNETRIKISLSRRGEKNPLWKGGVSDNRHKVTNMDYRQWVANVFARDNWTCQTCGVRGVYLQAHHIKSWAKYPDDRFNVENGVALCVPCHKLTDNYKGRANRKNI